MPRAPLNISSGADETQSAPPTGRHPTSWRAWVLLSLAALLPVALIVAWTLLANNTPQIPAIDQIHARGELRVVTLNSPTTYYLGTQGPQGAEYRLADAFARQLGVRLVMQPVANTAAMQKALLDGSADLAAAQITADVQWRRIGLASRDYAQVPQLVIRKRGRRSPRNIAQLHGSRLVVRANSPQVELLQELRRNGLPGLSWTEIPIDAPAPLARVSAGQADYAIVDANEYAFDRHLYPDASIAFQLPDARTVQWVVPRDARVLRRAVNRFFATARRSGLLARVEQDAAQESQQFNYLQAMRFRADVASRLPALKELFEQAATETGLDWRLIAAVGYQESKWDQTAQSNNGALGVMMLTTDAATAIGVSNRNDLKQNILGGARYLKQVIDTIPDRIQEPDRTWLGLAAYNSGYGHLEDARVIAQMRGKNPDSWSDVSEQLPLLADEEWYTRVKRGYARGWEPANFVSQVRQYLAVLEWFGAQVPPQPAAPATAGTSADGTTGASATATATAIPRPPTIASTAAAAVADMHPPRPQPGESAREARRRPKNSRSNALQSDASTPPNTSTR